MNKVNTKTLDIISNETLDTEKVNHAKEILLDLQADLKTRIGSNGVGPFLAAIYDEKGNLVSKETNSVVHDQCSNCHAEVNAIRAAEKKLGTYDLAPYNLSLYVTSEPCIMCLGAIMWSGIRNVYYGVTSTRVEEITGFDEGFKPDWLNEFKNRGITVYGNIATKEGEDVLEYYVNSGEPVYKPSR